MKKKEPIFKNVKKSLVFFKNVKKKLVVAILFSIALSLAYVLVPVFSANVVSNIMKGDVSESIKFALLVMAMGVTGRIIIIFYNRVSSKIQGLVLLNVRKTMCSNILDIESKTFDKYASGFFYERVEDDPESISNLMVEIQDYFVDILTKLAVIVYIFFISYILGIYFVIGVIILYLINRARLIAWKKLFSEKKKIKEKSNTLLNELIRGIRDVKVLNMKNQIIKTTNDNLETLYEANYNIDKTDTNYWTVYRSFEEFFKAGVVIIGGLLLLNNQISATNLIIIILYREQILRLISLVNLVKQSTTEYSVAIDRVFEVINGEQFAKEQFGTVKIKHALGKVEFKNITFGYEEKSVIENLSFVIKPNETVSFVGRSGSGKTTIFNLISKIYTSNEGTISIDDINIEELTKDSIRNNISIITQNPYLFNMTLKENLVMVKSSVTEKK